MDDGGPAASIAVFFIFLLIDAFYYGFSAAIVGLNEKEIDRRAIEDNDRKAMLLGKILKRPIPYVDTVQFVVTLINLSIGALYLRTFGSAIRRFFLGLAQKQVILTPLLYTVLTVLSLVVTMVLILYILLVFGVLIPKRLGSRYPYGFAYRMVKPIAFIMSLLKPFTILFSWSSGLILKFFRMAVDEEGSDVTEEEILSMVNEGHEQGVIQASEAEMISNIFEFGDKRAEDIMTNRTNIIGIDCEITFKEAVAFMLEGRNSRYPVYEENIDHIIGILHLKDALRHQAANDSNLILKDIPGLVRDARFIPATRKVDVLFRAMQSTKCQMVIVVDEYGQTEGIISMEDILEEIVGSILDEYDAEESFIREKGKDQYIMDGMTPLDDLEERLEITFEEEDFETLNGFMISRMERIPEPDEEFDVNVGGYNFKVLSVENKMIQSVLVTRLVENPED